MELVLEVEHSVAIKRKKPWPKLCWLGEEQYGLFLLDSTRISQMSLSSGKTKRTFPSLNPVLQTVVSLTPSRNGSYLAGMTEDGRLFKWQAQHERLTTFQLPSSLQDNKLHLKGYQLFISDDGSQVLLVTALTKFYLWEEAVSDHQSCSQWWQITPPPPLPADSQLSSAGQRRIAMDACFYTHPVLGDCCSCITAHCTEDGGPTTLTHLLLRWPSTSDLLYPNKVPEILQRTLHTPGQVDRITVAAAAPSSHEDIVDSIVHNSAVSSCRADNELFDQFSVYWKSMRCASEHGGRSHLVRLSPGGDVAAVAINRVSMADTRVMFLSPLTPTASLSLPLLHHQDHTKIGRGYWIADMSWSADGLLLVCVLKQGSLCILPRYGQPLKLITRGCSMDMGPAYFLPLHPLITVVKSQEVLLGTSLSSERDGLRQRFSVTTHPFYPVLLCSDGYMVSTMTLSSTFSLAFLVRSLVTKARVLAGLSPLEDFVVADQQSQSDVHHQHELSMTSGGFTETLNSTCGTVRPLGAVGTSSGVLQFVGLDEELDQTGKTPFELGNSTASSKSLGQSLSTLLTAWGIFVSTDLNRPGNGIAPCCWSLTVEEHSKQDLTQHHIAESLLATLTQLLTNSEVNDSNSTQLADILQAYGGFLHIATPVEGLGKPSYSFVTMLASLCSRLVQWSSSQCSLSSSHKSYTSRLSSIRDTLLVMLDIIDESIAFCVPSCQQLTPVYVSLAGFVFRVRDELGDLINASKSTTVQEEITSRDSLDKQARALDAILQGTLSQVHSRLLESGYSAKELDQKPLSSNLLLKAQDLYCSGNVDKALQTLEEAVEVFLSTNDGKSSSEENACELLSVLYIYMEKVDFMGCLNLCHRLITSTLSSSSTHLSPAQSILQFGATVQSPAGPLSKLMSHESLQSSVQFSSSPELHFSSVSGYAVASSLALLMSDYFCGRRMLVLSPMQPFPLVWVKLTAPQPPLKWLQLFSDSSSPVEYRMVELSRSDCQNTISRENELAKVWTPEHALELLLLCGLWCEAASLTSTLGDWKSSFTLLCLHLAHLKTIGTRRLPDDYLEHVRTLHQALATKRLNDIFLSEQAQTTQGQDDAILQSLSHLLLGCAMVEQDEVLITGMVDSVGNLVDLCRSAPLLVDRSVFDLPSPPPYCPQPTLTAAESSSCLEYSLRHKLATSTQKALSLMKASSCLPLLVHSYCKQLVNLSNMTDLQSALVPVPHWSTVRGEPHSSCLPDGLVRRATVSGDFQRMATVLSEDDELAASFAAMESSFRSLCAMLWYLHCREQASVYCRKLFTINTGTQVSDDCSNDHYKAVYWSLQLIPFSDFLRTTGTQESLDSLLLSFLAELHPNQYLVDTLAYAFPSDQQLNSSLASKLSRILTQLRSMSSVTISSSRTERPHKPRPLSVSYLTKTQAVTDFLDLLQRGGKFRHPCQDMKNTDGSSIDCFLFELDSEYHQFLETLLSVIDSQKDSNGVLPCSQSSLFHQLLHSPAHQLSSSPLLSAFCKPANLIGRQPSLDIPSLSRSSCENMSPFLIMFEQWSCIPLPSIKISCDAQSCTKSSEKSSDRVKEPFPRVEKSSSHIRVNFFLPFLVNCLQVTEEQLLLNNPSLPSLTELSSSNESVEPLDGVLPTTASELVEDDVPKIDHLEEPVKMKNLEEMRANVVESEVLEKDDEKQVLESAVKDMPALSSLPASATQSDSTVTTTKVPSSSEESSQQHRSDDLTVVSEYFETNISSTLKSLSSSSLSAAKNIDETMTFDSTTLPLPDEADSDHRPSLSTAEQLTDFATSSLDEKEMKKEEQTEEIKGQDDSLPSISETSTSQVTFTESTFQPVTARSEWRNDWTDTEEDETEDTAQQWEDEKEEDKNEEEENEEENSAQNESDKGAVYKGVVHLAVSGSSSSKQASTDCTSAAAVDASDRKNSKEKRTKKEKAHHSTPKRQVIMAAEMKSLQKQLLKMSQLMLQQQQQQDGHSRRDRAQSTSGSASPPRLCMTDLESLSVSAVVSDENTSIPPPLLLQAAPSGGHDSQYLSEVTDSTQLSPGAIPKLNLSMSTQESDQENIKEKARSRKKTRNVIKSTDQRPKAATKDFGHLKDQKLQQATQMLPLLKTAAAEHHQHHKPSFSEAYPGVDSFLRKMTSLHADSQSSFATQDEEPVVIDHKLPLLTIRDDNDHPTAIPFHPALPKPLPQLAWTSSQIPPSTLCSVHQQHMYSQPQAPSHFHRPPTATPYHTPLQAAMPGPIEFILPNVPIQPFIPRLVPPTAIKPHHTTHASPPLLSLSDPLSRMRQEGYRLLQLPSRGEGEHSVKEEAFQASSMKTTETTVRRRRRVRIQLSDSQLQSVSKINNESISTTQLHPSAAGVTGRQRSQKENHHSSPGSDRETLTVSSTPPSSPKNTHNSRLSPVAKRTTPLQDAGTQTLSNNDTTTTTLSPSSSSYSIQLEQWSREGTQTMVSTAVQVSPPGVDKERPEVALTPQDGGGGPEFISVDDIEEEESTIVDEELVPSAWSNLSSVSTLEEEEDIQKLPHDDHRRSNLLELPVKTTGLSRAPLLTPQSLLSSDKRREQPTRNELIQRFRVIDEQLSALERSAGAVASEMEGSRQVLSTIDHVHPSHKRSQVHQSSKTANMLESLALSSAVATAQQHTGIAAAETRRMVDHAGESGKEEMEPIEIMKREECPVRVPENTTVVEYRIRQQLITEKGQAGEHGEQLTRKATRNHSTPHEKREDRRRELQREYHKQRVEEAYALMNDLLSTSKPSSAPSSTRKPPLSRPTTESTDSSSVTHRRAPIRPAHPSNRPGQQPSNRHTQQQRQTCSNRLAHSSGALQNKVLRGNKMNNGTSTTTPCIGDQGFLNLKRTRKAGEKRRLSSVEGLNEVEQEKIVDILANTECDQLSISSGSITSSIDWSRVDEILTS